MNSSIRLSVIIPTHNPDPSRLHRTLLGLCQQTLPGPNWETILVDNASTRFPSCAFFADCTPPHLKVTQESTLGLTSARRHGFAAAHGEFAVLVDDDNVLAPDYLANVLAIFEASPRLGLFGGKSVPEFENPPPQWAREFFPLLALRDLGESPLVSNGLRPQGTTRNEYPLCAPIGAGMALRRAAWEAWINARSSGNSLSDRRGQELTSGGDNDIVLSAMQKGWEVAYFPQLSLIHLIPSSRLHPAYLERLNRGIQKSWMQVLSLHGANGWSALTPFGACLRKIRAWFVYRPWSSVAARIRWQGACGHFEGRAASLANTPRLG